MARGRHFFQGDRTFGRLLISSPQGHSGKTIVTLGLCKALRRRGLSIQPFKKGPDYIDPSWLTIAAGQSCRNLDLFLIPKEKLTQNFEEACDHADLALVEGAMGLYDGLDDKGTTAEIARLFDLPIILVVNTTRMTGSIAAMVSGYQHFQKNIRIAGVILNYVSGIRHEKKLKDAVEQYCGIPVVGSIPRHQDFRITERHLGLVPTSESDESESLLERIGESLVSRFDLDKILSIAGSSKAPEISSPLLKKRTAKKSPLFEGTFSQLASRPSTGSGRTAKLLNVNRTFSARGEPVEARTELRRSLSGEMDRVRGAAGNEKVRIGVIRDRAFNFYYPENLEALVSEGAELLFINSFEDRLPRVDGLYIGGGFPEFFLKELEENRELRKQIARAIHEGLPVYAECAGLMYLCQSISWKNRSYKMVGVIPAEVNLSEKPEGHGYVVAKIMKRNPLFQVGMTLRGHEFHHSSLLPAGPLQFAYKIDKGKGVAEKKDGIVYKNLLASYVHLHASGTPEWAKSFVAQVFRRKNGSSNLMVRMRETISPMADESPMD